jgi:hypothetical protein
VEIHLVKHHLHQRVAVVVVLAGLGEMGQILQQEALAAQVYKARHMPLHLAQQAQAAHHQQDISQEAVAAGGKIQPVPQEQVELEQEVLFLQIPMVEPQQLILGAEAVVLAVVQVAQAAPALSF